MMNHFTLILAAAGVLAIKADVDCHKRPHYKDLKDCCELSNYLTEEIKEKCMAQYGDNRGPPSARGGPAKYGHHKHCFLSCALNQTGILVDDELKEDNLISYLDERFQDSEKVEFLSNKFTFCNEKRKDFESNKAAYGKGPMHCPFKENGMLLGCVYMNVFKDCPDDYWSNTDKCNELRDHFHSCPFPFGKDDTENVQEGHKI